MISSNARRALIGVLAIAAASSCKPLDDGMVMIFGMSMRDQRSFDPYENTRPSPENSISFSSGNYPAEFGSVNVGQAEGTSIPRFTQADLGIPGTGSLVVQGLINPVDPTDPRSMERGATLYMRFCAVCHGEDGVGVNAYIADKHPTLPAYNVSGAQVAAYSDQYLYAMIRVGRGLMPEYGSRIAHFDRWTIVNYLRELQLQAGNGPVGEVSSSDPPAGE